MYCCNILKYGSRQHLSGGKIIIELGTDSEVSYGLIALL